MIKTCITQFVFATAVIGLVAGLCGCDILAEIVTFSGEGKEDGGDIPYDSLSIDIGMVAPLTGAYGDPYGISMERGFNLARDEINGLPNNLFTINFLVEDDMSTIDGAVAAVERLIEAGVPAIVGIPVSTHAAQAFPIAQAHQVVVFSPSSSAAGLSSIGDYIFRAALAVDRMIPAGVKATHAQLGYERVAMIYNDADVYSNSSNEHFTAALAELGVVVVTMQTLRTGDTDFTAQLTAIKEFDPDALFISALPPTAVNIMIQGREIGIASQYIVLQFGANEVEMAGEVAEGAITFTNWLSTSDNPINQAFVESYQSTYGSSPTPWAAQSYATLYILYHAIIEGAISKDSTTITIPDSMEIRDALAEVRDFPTNLGSFSFDADGEAVYPPVVLIIKDGSLVPFGVPESVSP